MILASPMAMMVWHSSDLSLDALTSGQCQFLVRSFISWS